MQTPPLLCTGPEDAKATLALAHGAGKPMDSPFMTFFAEALGERGVRVARFEFPYMAERRATGRKKPPDRVPVLLQTWRAVIDGLGGPERVFIGGKSMGGRMATVIASELEHKGTPVAGVACLGYPFHASNKPDNPRIEHLLDLKTPTLICQGARDTLGWYDEVVEFGLPDTIDFLWLEDGDHDLKPRAASGRTMRGNWREAADAIAAFVLPG